MSSVTDTTAAVGFGAGIVGTFLLVVAFLVGYVVAGLSGSVLLLLAAVLICYSIHIQAREMRSSRERDHTAGGD